MRLPTILGSKKKKKCTEMQRNSGGKRSRWTLADYYLSDVCGKNINLSSAAGYLSLAQRETWKKQLACL